VRGKECHEALLRLVDEDTTAFDALLAAFRLPQEHEGRAEAIAAATRHAIEVPLTVMEASLEALAVVEGMATEGLKSSVSDAGVGALLATAAVRGAHLNVRINAATLSDDATRRAFLERGAALEARARALEADILNRVEERLGTGTD
jgi:glutamate formiminotransferase/formiminotetrahydrofolate cyclodeaminase